MFMKFGHEGVISECVWVHQAVVNQKKNVYYSICVKLIVHRQQTAKSCALELSMTGVID